MAIVQGETKRSIAFPYLLVISPVVADFLQDIHHESASKHERVVGTLDNFDNTLVGAHGVLHPPYGVLRDSLVPVTIPDTDDMRISSV